MSECVFNMHIWCDFHGGKIGQLPQATTNHPWRIAGRGQCFKEILYKREEARKIQASLAK